MLCLRIWTGCIKSRATPGHHGHGVASPVEAGWRSAAGRPASTRPAAPTRRKTDAYAYLKNGITPLVIADDNEELPDGVRLIHPDAERSIWEQIEDAVFDEIGEAEIERRRVALYG